MNGKIKLINYTVLSGIIILSVMLSGCTLPNPFANSDKDKNIYSGTAEADEINITAELPGKIKEVRIQEGQKISSGELIAVIDSSENAVKMQQADINLKSAQNELGKVNEGNRAEEIKAQQAIVAQAESAVKQGETLLSQAQTSLDTAKVNYEYKQKIYLNIKALYDAGAESKNALDNAQNALDNSKSVRDNAANAVESSKAQIDGFKAQLNAARQKLNLLVNGATDRNKTSAQFGVDIASKSYELSKIALDKSNVVSASGGVVETINYKQGEYVSPGSPIATLLNMESMYVKVYVPEKSLPSISLDKEVKVSSDFLKDKVIKGKITYISPEAEFIPMNVVTKKDREKLVFAVKVKILDNLEYIKSGMLLDVNME